MNKILLFIFILIASLNATDVQTEKNSYNSNEIINVNFSDMLGNQDWIGIYKQNETNAWENVLRWNWTNDRKNGSLSFDALNAGTYEVRAFFNNSFQMEAAHQFMVENGNNLPATVKSSKNIYKSNEKVTISFNNMLGDHEDWIGIYKKGDSNNWENVLKWNWTNSKVQGTLTFNALPQGEYEVRSFFQNSFNDEAKYAFSVKNNAEKSSTLYEDAENGISNEWIHVAGNFAPSRAEGGFNSAGTVALVPEWIDSFSNLAYYVLPLHNNTQEKFLEMDMGGLPNYPMWHRGGIIKGHVAHYSVGVSVTTTQGKRRMKWDSFFNHGNVQPFRQVYSEDNIWLNFPSPVEHVRGWGYAPLDLWAHFKVDIEAELQKLEPNNQIISVDYFLATGGLLDNIKLSSE
ncbi:MAG TPA: hypothetical protein ENK82_08305 [Campylobacterales bacterium]|nr:hypothetical protein [Campylobacterales bacterium]